MPKSEWHHLYNTAQWKRLRLNWLTNNPVCVLCWQLNKVTPATVVDHKTAHKGNTELFYSDANLQSLCKPCHDTTKARQEHRGYLQGCNANGLPLDPKHHWLH
jgi:5-methylcytosine-specific restriction protein A